MSAPETSTKLDTQESPSSSKKSKNQLLIGISKSKSSDEKRVALSPEAVSVLIRNGHQVMVESHAGEGASFSDLQYSDAGAKIIFGIQQLFQEADIVMKIDPLMGRDFDYVRPRQVIFSAVNLPTAEKFYFDQILAKRLTTISFENMEDNVGGLPVVRAMGEIAGSSSILLASEFLTNEHGGKGVILGGITGVPPTKVVIIGAGTVGEYAARTALALGADIKVFDKHNYRLQRLKYAIGHQFYTSVTDSEALTKAVERADVVIGAIRAEEGISPWVISEETVSKMKANSIIIDISIDQGGCFETSEICSHEHPTFKKHGVLHYCVPNLPSRVSRTASMALSNIFTPCLLEVAKHGSIEAMIRYNKGFMKGVYAHNGSITSQHIAKRFDYSYKDLGLLIAASVQS